MTYRAATNIIGVLVRNTRPAFFMLFLPSLLFSIHFHLVIDPIAHVFRVFRKYVCEKCIREG